MTYRIPVRIDFSSGSHAIITVFQTETEIQKSINDANAAALLIPGSDHAKVVSVYIDAKTLPNDPELWAAGNAFGYYDVDGGLSNVYASEHKAREALDLYLAQQ